MRSTTEPVRCDDEAARMLPWFVNGTLSGAEARRVAAHLERCEACRRDAAEQGEVFALLQAPDQIEYSPTAGLRKLMQRIDASERDDQPASPVPGATTAGWRRSGNPVRWLAAAVVVQGVALGTIAGIQLLHRPPADEAASYRTLTADRAEKPSLRVAFVPTTTLAELHDLLRAHGLVAVAGPSDAGIFTLAPDPSNPERESPTVVLARLRADPRVRFAEPLAPEATAR